LELKICCSRYIPYSIAGSKSIELTSYWPCSDAMGNYKQFMGLSYVEASANILWDSKYINRMLGM